MTPRVWNFACAAAVCLLGLGCARDKQLATYPYVKPLSSPGQKFSGLPPAVQATVRSQAGAAEMYDIIKTNIGSELVYVVHFKQDDLFPPLYVAPDGSVLYPESTFVAVGAAKDQIGVTSGVGSSGLKLSDLPVKVVTTIQEKAPTAEIDSIHSTKREDNTFYEITFKDSARHPSLVIAEDGTVSQGIPWPSIKSKSEAPATAK